MRHREILHAVSNELSSGFHLDFGVGQSEIDGIADFVDAVFEGRPDLRVEFHLARFEKEIEYAKYGLEELCDSEPSSTALVAGRIEKMIGDGNLSGSRCAEGFEVLTYTGLSESLSHRHEHRL